MSGEFVLNAVVRGDVGKGASRRLRNDELVPAIVYGGTQQPRNVSLSHRELVKALENEAFFSHLITLKLADGAEEVILKDLQRHPARPRILHADFQRVSRDRKIHVHIPLHFINQEKCHGVKNQGGIIQHNANEVYVTCLPQDLPEYIEVDMTAYHVGQAVHLSDLELPAGVESVELSHGPEHDIPVATVLAPKGGAVEETPAS
ncbi:MAG: 50S ribosomal protein L25/general stress protein Ctc [Pseudomonadales bacterium]|jgi:large subunit ribosomal protein L25|nr:50S ribosomal protein L25/general stress protein Ctc [Pseudomonadales bacterium]MBP9033776.1 50S ribosomal protein L25/general stress protein Ctc [Pseudomonadales bacterium]